MKKIMDYFQCEILISELYGKKNVITFKSTVDSLLHSFYRKSGSDLSEKDAVIKAAAKLILEDIKSLHCDKQNYPTTDEILSLDANRNYVPASLHLFHEHILTSKVQRRKIVSIGQCIVQNCSPRSTIAPLQIGLGVQMHHHFGSKFLIDTLNSLGFCSSYSEVQRFELSAAQHWNIELEKNHDSQAVQFIADNVDHNVRTLDGFHGVRIIATITPEKSGCPVLHADDDADLIVDTAVQVGTESASPIVVIGEDTDILVLLCYHDSTSDQNLYFMSDSKTGTKKRRIWNNGNTRQVLGEEICQLLPFIHAFSLGATQHHIYMV